MTRGVGGSVSDVRVGAPVWVGYARRRLAGRLSRDLILALGEREAVVVALHLDPAHPTEDDRRRAFAARFGEPATDAWWMGATRMLATAGLLAEPAPVAPARRRTWLSADFPLRHRQWILTASQAVSAVMLRAGVLALAIPLAAAAVVLPLFDLGAVAGEARATLASPWVVLVALAALAMLAVHELAHAGACLHWGGVVRGTGLRWRLPFLSAYCDAGGVRFFPHRGQRVGTALAGVYSTALLLIPVTLAWLVAGGTGADHLRAVLSAVWAFGALSVGLNLLPVFGLDGYQALSYAVGVSGLSRSSAIAMRDLLSDDGRARLATLPAGIRVAYIAYGVWSLLFALVALAAMIGLVSFGFSLLVGPSAVWVVTAVAVVVVVLVALFGRRRNATRL